MRERWPARQLIRQTLHVVSLGLDKDNWAQVWPTRKKSDPDRPAGLPRQHLDNERPSHTDRRFDTALRKRQFAHPHAGGIGQRVANGRRRRPLGGFSGA